jgi:Pyruvate/2-oxoacid:ferredoxin oxidoreductase delta subunit
MALLNKDPKKKPLQVRAGAGGQVSPLRPVQTHRRPPCCAACPCGSDARGWLTLVAQHRRVGKELPETLEAAFVIVAATNPFPAVMGRVCPAPCEGACSRKEKDGAVSIRATERWIGDWGLERKIPLPRATPVACRRGKVAVVGAGPAGLSCAYQLARRGHSVVVFEASDQAGGSLRTVAPSSLLPSRILEAEITRILELGVELQLSTRVRDLASLDGLRGAFDAVCLAVGPVEGASGDEAAGLYRAQPSELVAVAIEKGRQVAAAIEAKLSGTAPAITSAVPVIGTERMKPAAYQAAPRAVEARRTADDLARDPLAEEVLGISQEQLTAEAERCYSCGSCFDCERCFLYCQNGAFEKLPQPMPGRYYKLKLEACNGCKKCANMCPCGCLDLV